MLKINRLAVFCGSKPGNNPVYEKHAAELATIIAAHKIELIYGGGKRGLMGTIADGVMKDSGTVRGIIPKLLINWEAQHEEITELLIVEDMHMRKRKLYELCDAAIIIAGGFGTLDELFEILTWNQLSIHDKKIFILNSEGFYDHLLAHLQKLSTEGFLYGNLEDKLVVFREPAELEKFLD